MVDLDKLVELAKQALLTKAAFDSTEQRMADEGVFDEDLLDQLTEDSDDATDAFQMAATPEVVISLLDRLARAEAERDTLLLWQQIAVDRGQHLGAALEQRDAAEARAQAAEAVCEAVWAYEYGDADMLDLSKLHEWHAARETQA